MLFSLISCALILLLLWFLPVYDVYAYIIPDTVSGDSTPYGVAVNPNTNMVYVTGLYQDSVSVIDGFTDKLVRNIPVGNYVGAVAVNSDTNMIYVTFDTYLSIIDGSTNSTLPASDMGNETTDVAVNPTTNRVYVTVPHSSSVFVVDGSSNDMLYEIRLEYAPWRVAVNSNTNMVYLINSDSDSVSVLDGTTNKVVSTIQVGNYPNWVAVNPNTNMIYVTNLHSRNISVINGTTNTLSYTITTGNASEGIAVNPDTNMIYVANTATLDWVVDTISVLDGSTNTQVANIEVGNFPRIIAVNQLTNMIYVTNYFSNSVSVIDGSKIESYNVTFPDRISSIYTLEMEGETYEIPYNITNAKVTEISVDSQFSEAIILIDHYKNKAGTIEVQFPRKLLDRVGNIGDLAIEDDYGFIDYDERTNCDYRTISFKFGKDPDQFILYGTKYGLDQQFPPVLLLDVDNQEFWIETPTDSIICDWKFSKEEKRLTVLVRDGTVLVPRIPTALLGGEFKVLVDGAASDFELEQTNMYSLLRIRYDEANVIDIIGTTVIPEFPVSLIILGVSFAGFLVAARLFSSTNKHNVY